jgi:hypothetical protein
MRVKGVLDVTLFMDMTILPNKYIFFHSVIVIWSGEFKITMEVAQETNLKLCTFEGIVSIPKDFLGTHMGSHCFPICI